MRDGVSNGVCPASRLTFHRMIKLRYQLASSFHQYLSLILQKGRRWWDGGMHDHLIPGVSKRVGKVVPHARLGAKP